MVLAVPGRKYWHSEQWWSTAPTHILRCNGKLVEDGSQCRREAVAGTTVCLRHGATAPQTLAKAATRIQLAADEAVKALMTMAADTDVAAAVRAKIWQDFLDRGGLVPTNKVLLGVVTDDPVERLFQSILTDPRGLVDPDAPPPPKTPEQLEREREAMLEAGFTPPPRAIEARATVAEPQAVEDDEDVLGVPLAVALGAINTDPPPQTREGIKRLEAWHR